MSPTEKGDGKYVGKKELGDASDELQHEAYELIISTCLGQIAEDYKEVHAEKAMGESCGQIASLIRAQMTQRHLVPNTLEPHGLALRLLELYEQAYTGLLPDGTPDPGIFSDSDS